MNPVDRGPLVVIGASARAAAQSAIRAGYQPWCVDLFADRDLCAIAPAIRCPAAQYPYGLVDLIHKDAPANAPLLYTGAIENYPQLLHEIAADRTILGCNADVVVAAREPCLLSRISAMELPGIEPCCVILDVAAENTADSPDSPKTPKTIERWLVKPQLSGGGIGIHFWSREPLEDGDYLQEYIAGDSIGAVFHASDQTAHLLGVNLQIIGDVTFGADSFRYAGSIGPMELSPDQFEALNLLGNCLLETLPLEGVFGIDAVIDTQGLIRPLEINPRYTAGVEILERATSATALIPQRTQERPKPARLQGKAILFAKEDIKVGDLYDLFGPQQVADVPQIGQLIGAGQPICTVFASGDDPSQCQTGLYEAARSLYTHLRQ